MEASRPCKGSTKQEVATLKLAKVWFLSVEIETYLKAVKKDLSPDWEDASVQLADVEVGMELDSWKVAEIFSYIYIWWKERNSKKDLYCQAGDLGKISLRVVVRDNSRMG